MNRSNRRNPKNQRLIQHAAAQNSNEGIDLYSSQLAKLELDQRNNCNECVVPITFRHLSELVDEILRRFESMNRNFEGGLFTEENKRIYKKVCFILAELKLDHSTWNRKNAGHLRNFDGATFY